MPLPNDDTLPAEGIGALLPWTFGAGVTVITGDFDTASLRDLCYRAIASNNPVIVLEAFCIMRMYRKTPPAYFLDLLAAWFLAYLNAQGSKRLDEIMELTQSKGGTPAFRRKYLAMRNESLILDVFRLTRLGFSVPDAAGLVALREEKTKRNFTLWKLPTLGGDRVLDLYKREQPPYFRSIEYEKRVDAWLSKNSKFFLSEFPQDEIKALESKGRSRVKGR